MLAGLRPLCWLVCPEAPWNVAAGFCFKSLLVLPFVINNHVSPLTGFRFPGVSVAVSVITVPSWHSHLALNLRSYTVGKDGRKQVLVGHKKPGSTASLFFLWWYTFQQGLRNVNVMSYECSCSIFRNKLAQCGLPGVPITTAVNRHSSLVYASQDSTWNELKLVHLLQEDVMNSKEHMGETSCLMFCCQFLIYLKWHQYELRCITLKLMTNETFILFVSC